MDETCEWKILNYFDSYASEYYELVNQREPYKYPFRIKSFITSLGRNIIGGIALRDIDNLIRVHTENFF